MPAKSNGKFTKKYYTANDTFTTPAGITEVLLIGCGGGGAGGGGGGNSGGGGGAAIQKSAFVTVVPNTSYTITIGAGGTCADSSVPGFAGSDTSFGTLFYAHGGGGGGGGASANWGGLNFPQFHTLTAQNTDAAGGGGGGVAGVSTVGHYNWLSLGGSYTGGAVGSESGDTHGHGGGGGGAGPQGNGATGGNGANNTGTAGNGSNGVANTGAGGGGGGGVAIPGTSGTGGSGGSGYLYVIWID